MALNFMGRPKKDSQSAPAGPHKKVVGLGGSLDVVAETDALWDVMLKRLNKLSRVYGFFPLVTPLLEDSQLYDNFYKGSAASGLFAVGNDEKFPAAVRPSLLPSVLRAYYEHKIFELSPMSKWCYSGLTARAGAGKEKLREDYEFGFEVLGSFNHLTEAQAIGVVWEFLQSLGLKDLTLEINNIGKADCQVAYQESLRDFLAGKKYDLCDACNEHLDGRVLNVFRCQNLDCQAVLTEAPTILDYLDEESHKHFTNILEALDELGVPYQLNPLLCGPDGHAKTNLAIKYKLKDETKILGEGGYHDGLMQNLCGKNFCCFGFSGSLLQVYELLKDSKTEVLKQQHHDVFLVPLGELAAKKSLRLFRDLTNQKVSVHDHFGQVGVKNQLKQADVFKAPIALIMGQKEAMDEMVILRDVKSGMQEVISYDKIVEEVKKRLGR